MTGKSIDAIEVCPVCGKPSLGIVNVGALAGVTVKLECDCSRDEEGDKREEAQRLEKTYAKCFGIKGFVPRTFADDDGANAEASKLARHYAERFGDLEFGLLMFGETDQGKTFLSECIAAALIEQGYSVVMRSVPDIVRLAQQNGFEDWMQPLMVCDLLILDDLGAERTTEFAQEAVYAVVDGRYRRKKKTLVSTNLTRVELQSPGNITSNRIYSRLLERCLPFELKSGRSRSTRERFDSFREQLS